MHWIALQWPPESAAPAELPTPEALGWWALQFTPHVAWVDEALLLEVSASLRLWGGRRALLCRMHESNPAASGMLCAQAAVGIVAIAMLRLRRQGQSPPVDRPAALPLHALSAARAHLPLLARLGCRSWGEVHALPRGPMVRRFGAELRAALDIAWGLAPERYPWLALPEVFEQSLELPTHVADAPALLWSANRLLASLQLWLRARQRGVLAFELQWRLDLKRLNGRELPPAQSLVIRTAEPAQAMEHLRRLLAERLARTPLLAPAVQLRLRSIDTAPWAAETASFLPEAQRTGDPLHVFIERVGARLGAGSVQTPTLRADHRPECMQGWQAAQAMALKASLEDKKPRRGAALRGQSGFAPYPAGGRLGWGQPTPPAPTPLAPHPSSLPKGAREQSLEAPQASSCSLSRPAGEGRGEGNSAHLPDALAPTWLLREPLPLDVQADGQPCHHGPLRLLAGPRRIEAGWWPEGSAVESTAVARDYYIAQNPAAELLWIYRERATSAQHDAAPRWFLQGRYG